MAKKNKNKLTAIEETPKELVIEEVPVVGEIPKEIQVPVVEKTPKEIQVPVFEKAPKEVVLEEVVETPKEVKVPVVEKTPKEVIVEESPSFENDMLERVKIALLESFENGDTRELIVANKINFFKTISVLANKDVLTENDAKHLRSIFNTNVYFNTENLIGGLAAKNDAKYISVIAYITHLINGGDVKPDNEASLPFRFASHLSV